MLSHLSHVYALGLSALSLGALSQPNMIHDPARASKPVPGSAGRRLPPPPPSPSKPYNETYAYKRNKNRRKLSGARGLRP